MIEKEFEGGLFPDKRLARRLTNIAAKTARNPAASFPQIVRSDSELEGIYRFLSNSRVRMEAILEPHQAATLERMAEFERVGVVHDSTQFAFRNDVGSRLGYLPGPGQRGLMGHFALAVSESGLPLGVLGLESLAPPAPRPRKQGRKHRLYSRISLERLAARWRRLVEDVRARVAGRVRLVHLMDREADSFELMNDIRLAGESFVIRLRHRDRLARAEDDENQTWRPVDEVVKTGRFVCEREVPLSRRAHSRDQTYKRRYAERERRAAKLRVEALPVLFNRPGVMRYWKHLPAEMPVNIVRVWEPAPPPGEDAVEWLLMTNEPIDTREQVEAVIDWYRRRWKIEEYFKALKTGCAFEKRQLQSRAALENTLAVLAPIAWQLLALRDRSRAAPNAPAASVLSRQQLHLLRGISKKPIPAEPSVEQALLAVAAQGGHLKRNGRPGWQTLGRGLEKLWWAEMGYQVARAESLGRKRKCDQ
jgi:hypothetical protein